MPTYSPHTTTTLPLVRANENHLDRSSILSARPAVILIDARPLIREALVSLLEVHFDIVHFPDADALAGAKNQPYCNAVSVVLNLGRFSVCQDRARSTIRAVRDKLGDVPIIIISDEEGIMSVGEALALDVKAYVTTSQTPAVLVGIIRLVKAGGTFMPAESLAQWNSDRTMRSAEALLPVSGADPEGLTKRQEQVLALVAEGKPNKIIAYQLSMRESTVKSHVRQIMRKCKVDNRTEAASLFLGHLLKTEIRSGGCRLHPESGSFKADIVT